jgi:hypothetical protein
MGQPRRKTGYETWIEQEGIPVVEGYGVEDVGQVPLGNWRRLGCQGAYVQMKGLEGITGVFVGEIPPGGRTESERHLWTSIRKIKKAPASIRR